MEQKKMKPITYVAKTPDQTKKQRRFDRMMSALLTFFILVVAIVLCAFMGYTLPNPPIEEEGMGVAGEVLGEIEGFGNNDMADFPSEAQPAPSSSAPDEGYTTASDPTPVAKKDKSEAKNTPEKPNESKQDNEKVDNNTNNQNSNTPTTNNNALFPGKKNGNSNEGKGAAEGNGQAGSPTGTQGATGGTGGGGGAGYSLNGRSLRGKLPQPSYNSSKEGDVVVEITVDRNGNVVEINAPAKGSKNYDNSMVSAAKEAAKKAHFNPDPNATERQKGTITYKFRRVG